MTTDLLDRPEVTDDATRREFLAGLAAAGLLVACGNGRDSGEGPARGATRTVDAANGPVDVPAKPMRVVSIDPVTTEHLAVLGIAAVGAQVEGFFEPLAELQPDATHIGSDSGLNLEVIATLDPDLIVGWPPFYDGVEAELGAIAPLVGTKREGFLDWTADLRFVADVVDRSAQAEEALAGYEARLGEVAALVRQALAGQTVSIMRFVDSSTVTIVTTGAFGASIAADAGLPRPPSGTEVPADRSAVERRNGEYDVSFEQVELLDADHLIVMVRRRGTDEEERASFEALRSSPLWPTLRFVQTDSILEVPQDDWLQGSSINAGRVLDDLAELASRAS